MPRDSQNMLAITRVCSKCIAHCGEDYNPGVKNVQYKRICNNQVDYNL